MKNIIHITCFFSLLLSCKSVEQNNSAQLYAVKDEYYHAVQYTIDQLDWKIDTFAYVTTVHGNCFGRSVSANSKFTWIKNGKSVLKLINKPPRQEEHVKKKASCNNNEFFNYFLQNRIDSITSLPQLGLQMSPESECILVVKCKNIKYTLAFDPFRLYTSKDTLHPVYTLLKMFSEIK